MRSSRAKRTFRILARKFIFRGHVFQLDALKIQTASGRRFDRELIRHRGAVVMVPLLRDGRLILVRQLRVAAGGWIWEFPAGTLERGESVRRCADRELREETGWRATRLKKVLEFYPTPGISTEKMHLFIAEGLKPANGAHLDPDEELETEIFSLAQVERMIRRGEIIDGKTILGFLFFRRYLLGGFSPA